MGSREDVKFVKNIAKDATGLTETEIAELEAVSEEDIANFEEVEVPTPIIPERLPTVEEIEMMETVEVLSEEDLADAAFPKSEEGSLEGLQANTESVEEPSGDLSTDGVSDSSEDDSRSEELEKILEEFDAIQITVEDVKAQKNLKNSKILSYLMKYIKILFIRMLLFKTIHSLMY